MKSHVKWNAAINSLLLLLLLLLNINAKSTRDSFGRQREPCYQCVNIWATLPVNVGVQRIRVHARANYRQHQTENYCFVCGNFIV